MGRGLVRSERGSKVSEECNEFLVSVTAARRRGIPPFLIGSVASLDVGMLYQLLHGKRKNF